MCCNNNMGFGNNNWWWIIILILLFCNCGCARCGGEAKVPFQPKADKPVFCSECFAQMRNN